MGNLDVSRMTDEDYRKMFCIYVESMTDKERHTEESCKEVDLFDELCQKLFPADVRKHNTLYEGMMNVAVEFEESGFIAGFQTASALILGQEKLLPIHTQIPSQKEVKPVHTAIQNPKSQPVPEQKPVKQLTKYIDTTEIGRIFGRTNFKTVRSINRSILPYLSEKDKGEFVSAVKKDRYKKEQQIYKLSARACQIYLDYCKQHLEYVNFKEGTPVFEKAIKQTFCGCFIA